MLSIEHVSKSFKGRKVLNEITLAISPGLFGLLGPNGAGKTTLIRILATILRPDSGRISFQGLSWDKHADEIRKILGYLPQDFGGYRTLTAWEVLEYISILKGIRDRKARRQEIESVLHEVNLADQARKKVGNFSGGMRRRLGIAQALLGDPQLIMVDEPTAGLDPEERIRFRTLLRRLAQKRTVLLSTHIVEDIQHACDGVAVIKKGTAYPFSSLQDLAKVAENKVWILTIKEEEFDQIEQNYKVISTQTKSGSMEVRLLSETPPGGEAILGEPTVEEGYLVWINS